MVFEHMIKLRPAKNDDLKNLYEWMYVSESSKSMFGAPLFPDKPTKTWEQFIESWSDFYYAEHITIQGHMFVIQLNEEDVGGICFHKPDHKNRAEIDIWLKSDQFCGKGLGSESIQLLCYDLYEKFGIHYFWVMPSQRNPRSIRAFQKSGFENLNLTPEQGKLEFGFQDYFDSVYLQINYKQLMEIKALEESLLNPETRKNKMLLSSLLSDDFVEFSSSGKVYTKDKMIEALLNEKDVYYSLNHFKIKELAQGFVLATYIANLKTIQPNSNTRASLRSSIWKETNEKWSMTFHQGTNIN